MSAYATLPFLLSSEVPLDAKVYLSRIRVPDAVWDAAIAGAAPSPGDMFVSCAIVADGVTVHAAAKSTRLPEVQYPWLCYDEWLTLPVKVRDLPPTAQLVRGV